MSVLNDRRRWKDPDLAEKMGDFTVVGMDRYAIATIRFDSGIEASKSYRMLMKESTPVDEAPINAPKIFAWEVDHPVEEALFEALGAVSVCWEHPELAGVFDSTRARQIGDELMDLLKRKLWADA